VTLWSIGHSTRSLDELTAVLRAHGIEAVADVRSFPVSHGQSDELTEG
jgi:uncharacterized protein (DUF488 family)